MCEQLCVPTSIPCVVCRCNVSRLSTSVFLPPTHTHARCLPPICTYLPAQTTDNVAIKLQGDFTWDPDKPPTLTGLNLRIQKGQMVAVVGPTGSAKTSLLSAMLGLLQGVTQDEDCEWLVCEGCVCGW